MAVEAPTAPPGKTSIADKYREALKAQNEPAAPTETPPTKTDEPVTPPVPERFRGAIIPKETPPVKSDEGSPLDVVVGDKKPAPAQPTPDENAWEKEESLKEFPSQSDIDAKKATWKRENWDNARKTIGTQSITIRELNSQIESLKGSVAKGDPKAVEDLAAARAEIEALKKTVSDQDTDIKSINAEYSQDYRKLVRTRDSALSKAVSKLESFAGKEKADALNEALTLPLGRARNLAIKEAMSDIDPDDKIVVREQITALENAEENIAEFRKDLPSRFDEIVKRQDEQRREAEEKASKQLETDFAKIADEMPETNVLLRTVPEDTPKANEWNGAIKAARETALRILKPGATLKESAELLIKGADYDRVVKMALDFRKQLLEANGRLSEFDSSGPDVKPTRKPDEGAKKLTPAEKYHKKMEELTAANAA